MTEQEERREYEGRGETLDEAFVDAADKALTDDRKRNLGRDFEVVSHWVTIENPRISEHRVTIGG